MNKNVWVCRYVCDVCFVDYGNIKERKAKRPIEEMKLKSILPLSVLSVS